MKEVTISPRFCGPPNSGNGGYVCGILANEIEGPAEVMLRLPPPLSSSLQLRKDGEKVLLMEDEKLVGEAKPGSLKFEAPSPPSIEEAKEASKSYIGFTGQHVFPSCFVCGPDREEGDGLCIYPGKLKDSDMVAAPWTPDASLANDQGMVKAEYLWSALDCPGAFAVMGDENKLIVLGKLTANIKQDVVVGKPYVVVGWPKGIDGRKYYSGTAVYDEKGNLHAVADAIWIAIKQ